jgi:hypothetical protein
VRAFTVSGERTTLGRVRWGEYMLWIPLTAAGTAFVAWVFMLATPLALLPDLFGVGQGTIITYAAVGGAVLALISPLILRDSPQSKKAALASQPTNNASTPRVSADVDNDVQLTRRQKQHRWYSDHRDLDWRDREQAESWGMDADTYKSNWREAD